jgi:hypothetical protein
LAFAQRAGLPSPGKSPDGWYGKDYFIAFGQYLAGVTRMAKAVGDAQLTAAVQVKRFTISENP